jgi:CHRD domain/PEP-CTERM motif
MKTHALLRAAVLLALVLPSVNATTITYNILFSGLQSVPANGSTATGNATVTVNDTLDTVAVTLSFAGLTGGNASAAHIHCCVPTNANGPVVIPFTGFPNTTSGTYSNTFTGVDPVNIAGIEAGQAYINIHNATFPGGEIRADILAAPVPEPTSIGLTILALSAAAALRRRLRQS